MLDRRNEKDKLQCEVDDNFKTITDTEIMNEFRIAVKAIYPSLIKVRAFCYDPWDDLIESLYYNFVYSAFSGKYGVPVRRTEHHRFGKILHCYMKIHHVNCEIQSSLLEFANGKLNEWTLDLQTPVVWCFQEFGTPGIELSGECKAEDVAGVNFNYVRVVPTCPKTGYRFKRFANKEFWAPFEMVKFQFVAETFDEKEHTYYRDVFA